VHTYFSWVNDPSSLPGTTRQKGFKGMKSIKLFQCATLFTAVIVGCCLNAAAQPTISVQRTGQQNIYKDSCSYSTTTFTFTSYDNYSGLEAYVYIGGEGDGLNSDDIDPCWAASQHNGGDTTPDFIVSGSGLSELSFVPHLYEITMPPFTSYATITVVATNSASNRCTDPYSTLLVSLPDGEDYTGDEYFVSSEAPSDTANLYPGPIDISPQFTSYPANLYKSLENTVSITLQADKPFPAETMVTFFIGGDGTAFTSGDPCYAVDTTDFTVSGASKAPFPNGFYVYFEEGETTKTFTVTAVDSASDCDEDYQTLLVTVPPNPGCVDFLPGDPDQLTVEEYP
jgi:hypothetical protein